MYIYIHTVWLETLERFRAHLDQIKIYTISSHMQTEHLLSKPAWMMSIDF